MNLREHAEKDRKTLRMSKEEQDKIKEEIKKQAEKDWGKLK